MDRHHQHDGCRQVAQSCCPTGAEAPGCRAMARASAPGYSQRRAPNACGDIMTADIKPFHISVSDDLVDDLRSRLRNTRWPEAEVVDDWSQGAPLKWIQDICLYWAEQYDWRKREALLNRFTQFTTEIDGLDFHFIHVRSQHSNAMPLIMTHGWPSSIVEFHKVIEPLTDPVSYGGDAADAFHLVCPSLPGFGFSAKPTKAGWGVDRIARAWASLMQRLGYPRYGAQGGEI